MSTEKTFKLDEHDIPFREGDTIMDAAMRAGVYIPHLCHNPEFEPNGSCRVCTVGTKGRQVAACTTPAAEGMEVDNSSEAITTERRTLVEMLFVEGNHICPGCERSGACQLQAVAYYLSMLSSSLPHLFPRREVDASHPDYAIDFNRCILCELCVRASRDRDGKNVFSIGGRGIHSHLLVNSPTGRLGDSTFEAADKAAHVCPVAAIIPKHRGYDTPIGQRLYDREPISRVGDLAAHEEAEESDHG